MIYPLVLQIGRIFIGGTGALLIYLALFLYEEEEGKLQNRLEQWWQQIRRLHHTAISWETAFLKIVIQVTLRGLDRLFGERLFGSYAIRASIQYSLAAIVLFFSFFGLFVSAKNLWQDIICIFAATFFVAWTTRGPQNDSYKWTKLILTIATGYAFLAILFSNPRFELRWYKSEALAACVLVLAVMSDFFFVALFRASLRWISKSESFVRLFCFSIAIGLASIFFAYLPLMWSRSLAGFLKSGLPIALVLLGAANCLDVVVSLGWVAIAAIMLLHRVIWPLAERPIHALYRHHLFTRHRRVVLLSGVGLLGLAVPILGDALVRIVEGYRR